MKRLFFPTRQGLITIGCVLFVGLLFSACTKSSNNNTNTPSAAFMAFNLVPDKTQGLRITLGNNTITQSALQYPGYTGTSGYMNIYTGNTNILAFDYSNLSVPITNSNYTFDTSRYYSLFVVGANNVYSNVVVLDNFDNLSGTSGQAYVRYINAIPDSSNPKITIADATGSNVVNETAHFTYVSQFIPVTPGTVTVTVSNGGTIQATNTNISLTRGVVYTVLLYGLPGSTNSATPVKVDYAANGQLSGS